MTRVLGSADPLVQHHPGAKKEADARKRQAEGQKLGGGDHRQTALGSAEPRAVRDESKRTSSLLALDDGHLPIGLAHRPVLSLRSTDSQNSAVVTASLTPCRFR